MNQEKLDKLARADRDRVLYNYHFDLETGEPWLQSPGFLTALKFLQQVQKFRPAAAAANPVQSFQEGSALFAIATLADVFALQQDRHMKDRFAVSRVPGSKQYYAPSAGDERLLTDPDGNAVPYMGSGGWLGAVSVNAAHPEAAQNFLQFLGGPQTSLEIVLEPRWGGGPTRQSHMEIDNRSGWFGYGLGKSRTDQMLLALEAQCNPTTVNPVYRLRLPDQQAYRDAFVEAIRPALTNQISAEIALAQAAQRWKEIGKGNPAARLKEYRLSIGLN
jgi:multiple sugar transport system substrate-binding protein